MLYTPPAFKIDDIALLHDHIERTGLAMLVTSGPDGPLVTHAPLLLERDADGPGRLVGHLARANPQVARSDPAKEAVAVFQGPDAYVSPSWYPSKNEHGRVVPTWNCAVVHARGKLAFFEDKERLHAAVERLTGIHEARFAKPWSTGDAPAEFIAAPLKGIIGIELSIERLEGKYKLSQNRSAADQAGVEAGLRVSPNGGDAAAAGLMTRKDGR